MGLPVGVCLEGGWNGLPFHGLHLRDMNACGVLSLFTALGMVGDLMKPSIYYNQSHKSAHMVERTSFRTIIAIVAQKSLIFQEF